jgi:hypothetical protein
MNAHTTHSRCISTECMRPQYFTVAASAVERHRLPNRFVKSSQIIGERPLIQHAYVSAPWHCLVPALLLASCLLGACWRHCQATCGIASRSLRDVKAMISANRITWRHSCHPCASQPTNVPRRAARPRGGDEGANDTSA